MSLPSEKNFSRRGAFPLALLLFVGVIVTIGGVYVVREQFLKEGKSGKTAYDEAKVKEQIKNPQELPEIKEEPKGELAAGPFVYKSTAAGSSTSTEPSFSITPPAGWEKFTPGETIQVQFKSTEEDREDMEDGLYVKSKPQISVSVQSTQGNSLDEIVKIVKNTTPSIAEKMTVTTQRKTQYAGQDAYYFEVELFNKGAVMRTVDYYLVKDGYLVHTSGTALKKYWSQREPAISGSLATFKLL